jgi:hypothetical protein
MEYLWTLSNSIRRAGNTSGRYPAAFGEQEISLDVIRQYSERRKYHRTLSGSIRGAGNISGRYPAAFGEQEMPPDVIRKT